jgi:hypothetical protein
VFAIKRLSDKAILKRTTLAATGKIVDIYTDMVDFESHQLATLADQAYAHIGQQFGFQYDHHVLGARIQIHCSDAVKVSHVHGGYNQAKEPLGKVFLNNRAAHGAVQGVNATYIHEMVHLFTWHFCSHTLREGLADYAALALHSGAAVGPVPLDFALSTEAMCYFSKYWATTKKPPRKLKTDIDFRRGYYFSSRIFVTYLIEHFGLDLFMKLYASSEPETTIEQLYQQSRQSLVAQAIASKR